MLDRRMLDSLHGDRRLKAKDTEMAHLCCVEMKWHVPCYVYCISVVKTA